MTVSTSSRWEHSGDATRAEVARGLLEGTVTSLQAEDRTGYRITERHHVALVLGSTALIVNEVGRFPDSIGGFFLWIQERRCPPVQRRGEVVELSDF